MTEFCNCRIISPVRDGMSVENIPHPIRNPVRDAMSVAADDGRTAYGYVRGDVPHVRGDVPHLYFSVYLCALRALCG
jgi:hypothetical protein